MLMRHFTAIAIAIAMTAGLSTASAQNVGKADVTPRAEEPGQSAAESQAQPRTQAQPRAQSQPIQTQPGSQTRQPVQRQPAGTSETQPDRYEARRASNDSQQQGVTVQEALVQKLTKANKAEIELAELAQQKTDNEEVQQLTKTIIEDHRAFNESLKQVSQQNRSANNQNRSSQDRLSQNRSPQDRSSQSQATTNRNQPRDGQPALNRTGNSQQAMVPKELCKISEQACDNALKMTKEMLNNQSNDDFNMAYLGQQYVTHTMMLAELKAIQSEGPQELQSTVGQAIDKIEKHLNKVKQLSKKLADQKDGSSPS